MRLRDLKRMVRRRNINWALKRRQLKKDLPGFIILGILFVLMCLAAWLLYVYAIGPLIRVMSQPEVARNWILSHGKWSYIFFVGMVMLQVIVAVIPGEPFQIAAGLAFGPVMGTLLCMLGMLAGSVTTFMLTRIFGYRIMKFMFSERTLAKLDLGDYNPETIEHVVFVAFIIPGTPKDLLSYAVGLTPLSLKSWVIITLIARFPSVLMAAVGGEAISGGNYLHAVIYLLIGAAMSGIMYLIYEFVRRKK